MGTGSNGEGEAGRGVRPHDSGLSSVALIYVRRSMVRYDEDRASPIGDVEEWMEGRRTSGGHAEANH